MTRRPCATRCSARGPAGQGDQLWCEGGLEVLAQQPVGRADVPRDVGRRRRTAHQRAAHRRDLLEQDGPVRHGPLDSRGQRERRGELRHGGPLAAELEAGDEVVQVVHVGEVVEHEAERHPGPRRDALCGRIGIAGANSSMSASATLCRVRCPRAGARRRRGSPAARQRRVPAACPRRRGPAGPGRGRGRRPCRPLRRPPPEEPGVTGIHLPVTGGIQRRPDSCARGQGCDGQSCKSQRCDGSFRLPGRR